MFLQLLTTHNSQSHTHSILTGSTDEYWRRQDAAEAVAQLLWEGLGLDGGNGVGAWESRDDRRNKVLLGIGGGHYVPRQMDIVRKEGVWVGHLLSGYSLPMVDPGKQKPANPSSVGGTWKASIRASFQATRLAFPEGEIVAFMDHKSFKSWQKNAITSFLAEENIRVGKLADFI